MFIESESDGEFFIINLKLHPSTKKGSPFPVTAKTTFYWRFSHINIHLATKLKFLRKKVLKIATFCGFAHTPIYIFYIHGLVHFVKNLQKKIVIWHFNVNVNTRQVHNTVCGPHYDKTTMMNVITCMDVL